MPTLHLKMTPQPNGITKISLSNPLRSQNFTLKYAVVNKIGAGFAHDHIFVRLPFASASQIHSSHRRGYLTLPTQASAAGMETHYLDFQLPMANPNSVFPYPHRLPQQVWKHTIWICHWKLIMCPKYLKFSS